MKIICCTMYSPSHKELAGISVPNFQEYCERHGYEFRVIRIDNDRWEYKKHEAFQKWMGEGECDLIFYKDVDSIVTNMKIPLTEFIDEDHDLFITKDETEINGGSLIFKNSKWGRMINGVILGMRHICENEQNAMVQLECGFPMFYECMKTLPHPSINSYLYEMYPEIGRLTPQEGQWEEGQFVLHTPALPMEKRIEILKNATITR
jgi:hypothetical protein